MCCCHVLATCVAVKMLFDIYCLFVILSLTSIDAGNYHEQLDISAYGALGVGREMIVFDLGSY